jgi:GT2 family glycosyltransferase
MVWLEHGTQNAYGALAGAAWVDPQRYMYGANVSLKRSLAVHVGGYDAQRFPGYGWEDVEFGIRLASAGFRLFYEPTARARHVHSHTVSSFLTRQRAAGRSLVTLQTLHPQSAVWSPKVSTARWLSRRVLYPQPLRFLAQVCATFASRRWILPRLYAVVSGWAFTDGVQEQRMAPNAGVDSLRPHITTSNEAGHGHFSASYSQKVFGERVWAQKGPESHPHVIHRLVHKK